MVNFNERYHFSRFQRGSNIFQGGGGGGGGSVFVKSRHPAKIATYFAFCASYFDKLVHRLYYKAVNLARFMTMSAGCPKT